MRSLSCSQGMPSVPRSWWARPWGGHGGLPKRVTENLRCREVRRWKGAWAMAGWRGMGSERKASEKKKVLVE